MLMYWTKKPNVVNIAWIYIIYMILLVSETLLLAQYSIFMRMLLKGPNRPAVI